MRFGGLNTVVDFHPTLLCLIHPQPSWWVLGAPLLECLGSVAPIQLVLGFLCSRFRILCGFWLGQLRTGPVLFGVQISLFHLPLETHI